MSINKAEEAGREKPRGPWWKEVVDAGNRLLEPFKKTKKKGRKEKKGQL